MDIIISSNAGERFAAFSENLQYIRDREGITQEQMAEQMAVSRRSVSKWEVVRFYSDGSLLKEVLCHCRLLCRGEKGCGMIILLVALCRAWLCENAWSTAWRLFPAGGILCGIASIVLNSYKEAD